MTNTNITAFRKDLFSMLSNTIKYNETINISTKEGNAIVLSEEEYNGIIATLELCAESGMKDKLIAGMSAPAENFIGIDEIEW